MDKQQIIDTVNEFLIEEFEADAADLVADANMHETLDLDSLDYVRLAFPHSGISSILKQ